MKRNDLGFTLIEILLAVSLSSIIAVAVYRMFSVAAKANERVESGLKRSLHVLSAVHVLEKDLNNVVYYKVSSESGSFKGASQEMTMVVDRGMLRHVRYWVNKDGDLLRSEAFLSEVLNRTPSARQETLLQASDLKEASFSFGYLKQSKVVAIVWKEDWHKAVLPFAVRCSVHIWSGPAHNNSVTYERSIIIPHGEWGT